MYCITISEGICISSNYVYLFADFGGCIKNIRVNRRPFSLEANGLNIVNVNMDGCPEATPSQQPCQSTPVEVIYQGQANVTFDTNRLPFTGLFVCFSSAPALRNQSIVLLAKIKK